MAQPILHYEPAPPSRRARRVLIRCGLVILLVVVDYLVFRLGKPSYDRLLLLRAQSRLLAYSRSADQVVFEQFESNASAAAAADSGIFKSLQPRGFPTNSVLRTASADERLLSAKGGLGFGYPYASVFAHERISLSGNRRLVIVQIATQLSQPPNIEFDAFVYKLADWNTGIQYCNATYLLFEDAQNLEFFKDGSAVRVFAGQPSAKDKSQFSIRYSVSGETFFVDGWLEDDDTVSMEFRGGPASVNPNAERRRRIP